MVEVEGMRLAEAAGTQEGETSRTKVGSGTGCGRAANGRTASACTKLCVMAWMNLCSVMYSCIAASH